MVLTNKQKMVTTDMHPHKSLLRAPDTWSWTGDILPIFLRHSQQYLSQQYLCNNLGHIVYKYFALLQQMIVNQLARLHINKSICSQNVQILWQLL